MASLNKVNLIGRTGKDPEIKTLPSGIKIAKFSIATSERFKKGENWEEKTEWHNIVAFAKTAEKVERDIQKGTLIHLEGKISTSSWETESGEKRYKTEIMANHILTLLDRKERSEEGGTQASQVDNSVNDISQNNQEIDDDLPF